MGDDLSYGLNTLGPLCLWQCFYLNIVWKHKCLIQVSWQQVNGKGIIVEIVNTDCMADLTCEGAIVMNSCQMDEEVNFR